MTKRAAAASANEIAYLNSIGMNQPQVEMTHRSDVPHRTDITHRNDVGQSYIPLYSEHAHPGYKPYSERYYHEQPPQQRYFHNQPTIRYDRNHQDQRLPPHPTNQTYQTPQTTQTTQTNQKITPKFTPVKTKKIETDQELMEWHKKIFQHELVSLSMFHGGLDLANDSVRDVLRKKLMAHISATSVYMEMLNDMALENNKNDS
jgi:anti-sigma28 factor (negative regulator of flagellin synthesis)